MNENKDIVLVIADGQSHPMVTTPKPMLPFIP